ncbi:hypothetical protein [Treponema brennaborense]|uniref:Uncharacterized protein n=1 Tax=Treponema brennaborense (strain DSM 12168 / CIP 105900 / DD5/3) TaxID=906968 RepID=F4LQ71_TREBD|nr:hypothetical protein [Treponema brennaborense]AEE16092.1 hypothetical protein Trebr_0650 [Treponema brennaborense DSM 12168]
MVVFDTGLTENVFARAKYAQYLTEEGICVTISGHGTYTFKPWRFTGTKETNSFISFYAEDFTALPYRSLYDTVLEARNTAAKTEAWRVLTVLCEILCQAERQHPEIIMPVSGPAGILVSQDAFLFLPGPFCEHCFSITHYNQWIHPSLTKKADKAYAYMCAALSYTIITGTPPFVTHGNDFDALVNDMADANFLPLEYTEYHCDAALARTIQKALLLPVKTTFAAFAAELPVRYEACVQNARMETTAELESFIQKKNTYGKKQQKRIRRRRFLKNHTAAIRIAVVFIVITAAIGAMISSDKAHRPSTLAMSAQEVVQTYYTCMNTLEQFKMDQFLEKTEHTEAGSAAANYNTLVTSLFMTEKARIFCRAAADLKTEFYSPAEWLLLKNPFTKSVFGISQLSISGNSPAESEIQTFTVSFYFFQGLTENDDEPTPDNYPLKIVKNTDRVAVSFIKDRYLITGIETIESRTVPVDAYAFFAAYDSLNGHIPDTFRTLYPWIPNERTMKKTERELLDTFSFYGADVLKFQTVKAPSPAKSSVAK